MTLRPAPPRVYLPAEIDLSDVAVLDGVYARLEADLAAVKTVEGLQEWLDHSDEVDRAVSEEGARRDIERDQHTDDEAKERAYLQFVDEAGTVAEKWGAKLNEQLVAHPLFDRLPPYYDLFRKAARDAVLTYREENIARETALETLAVQYGKVVGEQSIEIDGEEVPFSVAGDLLDDPDRAVRRTVSEKRMARRMEDREEIDRIFDRQIALRQEIAREVGYENYRDFVFRNCDYRPEDCFAFHRAIEECVVPLARQIMESRRKALEAAGQLASGEALRPWDQWVDPQGRAPLRPFHGGQDTFDRIEKVFAAIDPRFTESFRLMRENGTTDLDARQHKAPGGYNLFLPESGLPFIFMNGTGSWDDGHTLIHENGHAVHGILAHAQRLEAYRGASAEMNELASMSAELLAVPALGQIYPPEELGRLRREQLEQIVLDLPSYAGGDAFQHWVYTHPGHSHEERDRVYLDLINRFEPGIDRTGYEAAAGSSWQAISHFINTPFYYLDYAIAQVGALQVEQNYKKDPQAALDAYFYALKQGGSKPLAELYADAGVKFDMTARTLGPLMDSIRQELGYPPRPELSVPVPRQELRSQAFERRPVGGEMLADAVLDRQK